MNISTKEILRFTTAGSVDDGKSTLIGRLLYDSKSIFEDQLEAVENSSKKRGLKTVDLALLTDGLKDEREQGITIDVAYRYFSTPKRKFIIADTPGHIQYTRNMVTGASTANAALILIDARKGIVEQTKRHSYIASLLRIPHLIVCINKMDLVASDENVFNDIFQGYQEFAASLKVKDIQFIPISALLGDNVVHPSQTMNWYKGLSLLETLESLPLVGDTNFEQVRFPIQTVIRPKSDAFHDYRGYAGRLASGILKKGDQITLLPTGLSSTVKSIDACGEFVSVAFPPMSIAIELEDDIDLGRGDMLVKSNDLPTATQDLQVMMCWLHGKPLDLQKKYYLKHTTNEAKAVIKEIIFKIDINTMQEVSVDTIGMNDIFRAHLRTTKLLLVDAYQVNRITGSLILIDDTTFDTVAAGMII